MKTIGLSCICLVILMLFASFKIEAKATPVDEPYSSITEETKCTEHNQKNLSTETTKEHETETSKPVYASCREVVDEDFEYLFSCVSAETYSHWGEEAKSMIATVIMNRVESDIFPDSVVDVVSQEGQFETFSNGTIWTAEKTATGYDACYKVYYEDYRALGSDVLYFCTEEYYDNEPSTGFFHTLNEVYSVNNTIFFSE